MIKAKSHLNSSSKGNHFIWIDSDIWVLASQLLYKLLNSWDTCWSTNKDDFVKILKREFRIPQWIFNWCPEPETQVLHCSWVVCSAEKSCLTSIDIQIQIQYLSRRSEHNSSNLALVMVVSICLGPSAVAVMNGKLKTYGINVSGLVTRGQWKRHRIEEKSKYLMLVWACVEHSLF